MLQSPPATNKTRKGSVQKTNNNDEEILVMNKSQSMDANLFPGIYNNQIDEFNKSFSDNAFDPLSTPDTTNAIATESNKGNTNANVNQENSSFLNNVNALGTETDDNENDKQNNDDIYMNSKQNNNNEIDMNPFDSPDTNNIQTKTKEKYVNNNIYQKNDNDIFDKIKDDDQASIVSGIQNIEYRISLLQAKRNELLFKLDPNMTEEFRRESTNISSASIISNNKPVKKEINKKSDDTVVPKERLNVIDFMQHGGSLLKYGKRGAPHFRHFEINERYLVWYSNHKSLDKTRIALRDIKTIRHGQLTENFKKYLQPKLANCSFSVIYGDEYKTLDVIAINKHDYTLWNEGLTYIINWFKEQPNTQIFNLKQTKYIEVAKRNFKSIEKKLKLQPNQSRKSVQKELDTAQKKYQKLVRLSNDLPARRESTAIKEKLVELEDDMERLRDLFEKKNRNVTSHEIWRASVELKTLENKIGVVRKTQKAMSM